MSPVLTATQISTVSVTVGQQCDRSTTVHHLSTVSSISLTHATANVNSISQLPQGVLCVKYYSNYIYIIII